MGKWSKAEIEEAFEKFQAAAHKGGTTKDWNDWANLFTEDAEYFEHLYGRMHGREEIRAWIHQTMQTKPADEMSLFPVEWYIVDEERGWVVCQIWNQMDDPGDGSVHREYNFTLLKYAGNGLWSYEEDVYNPHHFAKMIEAWQAAKSRNAS